MSCDFTITELTNIPPGNNFCTPVVLAGETYLLMPIGSSWIGRYRESDMQLVQVYKNIQRRPLVGCGIYIDQRDQQIYLIAIDNWLHVYQSPVSTGTQLSLIESSNREAFNVKLCTIYQQGNKIIIVATIKDKRDYDIHLWQWDSETTRWRDKAKFDNKEQIICQTVYQLAGQSYCLGVAEREVDNNRWPDLVTPIFRLNLQTQKLENITDSLFSINPRVKVREFCVLSCLSYQTNNEVRIGLVVAYCAHYRLTDRENINNQFFRLEEYIAKNDGSFQFISMNEIDWQLIEKKHITTIHRQTNGDWLMIVTNPKAKTPIYRYNLTTGEQIVADAVARILRIKTEFCKFIEVCGFNDLLKFSVDEENQKFFVYSASTKEKLAEMAFAISGDDLNRDHYYFVVYKQGEETLLIIINYCVAIIHIYNLHTGRRCSQFDFSTHTLARSDINCFTLYYDDNKPVLAVGFQMLGIIWQIDLQNPNRLRLLAACHAASEGAANQHIKRCCSYQQANNTYIAGICDLPTGIYISIWAAREGKSIAQVKTEFSWQDSVFITTYQYQDKPFIITANNNVIYQYDVSAGTLAKIALKQPIQDTIQLSSCIIAGLPIIIIVDKTNKLYFFEPRNYQLLVSMNLPYPCKKLQVIADTIYVIFETGYIGIKLEAARLKELTNAMCRTGKYTPMEMAQLFHAW